jgi:hypothetical protein
MSRPLVPPGPLLTATGTGYETVYVLKGAMTLTLAGKPILFPSPVYVRCEYEDGIHMIETPEMSILVFVPNHWDDSEDDAYDD